jgi:uncharacterized ion transporter superfamily protein YfcC
MGKFRMPTAYTILFGIILAVLLLTWVVPAGQYSYNAAGEPIAGSYHRVDSAAQPITALFTAPVEGLYQGIDIAAFILMVGGFLGVVAKTGAIDGGITHIIRKLKGKESLLIPILMCAFALGGTTFGMAEETIAFYPLVLPIMVAAGYDTVTAVATILLGAGVGVIGSTVNPFATGIAAGFAGVSLGEGIVLRLVQWVVFESAAIWFVMDYAAKVKKNPSRSVVGVGAGKLQSSMEEAVEFTGKRKVIMAVFAGTFLVMIYSVIPFDELGTPLPALGWWFPELSALFLVGGVVIGLIDRMGEEELVETFVAGCADMLGVSLIIGISRGITVLMNEGAITDTILHWGETALSGAGPVAFVLLVYLIYLPLSFLIPSSSGLATLSIPIIAPLGKFAGVGGDLVVTAFQSASGLVNIITPTAAVVMGALALGHVPYDRWLKYVWKLMVYFLVLTCGFLAAGVFLG